MTVNGLSLWPNKSKTQSFRQPTFIQEKGRVSSLLDTPRHLSKCIHFCKDLLNLDLTNCHISIEKNPVPEIDWIQKLTFSRFIISIYHITEAGHIFQARPVWICTQSNITNIIFTWVHNTNTEKIIFSFCFTQICTDDPTLPNFQAWTPLLFCKYIKSTHRSSLFVISLLILNILLQYHAL